MAKYAVIARHDLKGKFISLKPKNIKTWQPRFDPPGKNTPNNCANATNGVLQSGETQLPAQAMSPLE